MESGGSLLRSGTAAIAVLLRQREGAAVATGDGADDGDSFG